MSSTPKIICRVKAIYPFYSNEPSSLNFEKDDYIDVLAQLDSGWWDGWCGGSRGWFPSNYVQVVEDNVADNDSLIDYDKEETPAVAPNEPIIAPPRQKRLVPAVKTRRRRSSSGNRRRARPLSLSYPTQQTVNFGWTGRISNTYSSDDDESVARADLLPDGWSIQVAEDGRTYYYYNHRTGKMQYEHPGTLSDDDSEDGYIYHRQSVDSFGEAQFDKPSVGNRLSLDSLPANVDTSGSAHIADSNPNIMSQWVERKTPQGRTYYCNLVTQETTWNLDDVDLKTGRLKNARDSPSDSEEEAAVNHIRQQSLRDISTNIDPHFDEQEAAAAANVEKPSTWQKLSSETALAIQQLTIAAQRGDQQAINDYAWSVVDTIRIMLYASGSLDKDASHMQDRALRDPQRAVMASLSKLVLSVKSASESPKSETLYRVQRDAGDVLAAVRAFVTACQDKHVGIIQVRPQLLVDTSRTSAESDANPEMTAKKNDADGENTEKANRRASQELPAVQKAKYSLNQDLVISLQTHANQIFGSTGALSKATAYVLKVYTEPLNDDEIQDERRDGMKARSNVVILFRNLSMQLGQYLSILEDIDMVNMDGSKIPSLPDFRVSKQGMYNAVGYLFHAVQMLSNEDSDLATATNTLEDAVRQCETVVESVLRNVEDMVEQRKIWHMKTGLPDRDAAMSPTAYDADDGGLDSPVIRSGLEKSRKSQYTIRPPEERSADWCLGYDYALDEIVFSSDGNVKGGTLRALVERLTLHDALDTSFIATFLLTYRSFCTTDELFKLLEQRYELQPTEGLTPFELETWTERKQKLVRLRVFNVMKSWLENYYNDEDEGILLHLEFFTNTVIRDASPFSADQLNRLIRKRKELNANKGLKKLVPNAMAGPLPIIPKDMSRVTLLDIDPLELSRQLTLLDFKLYSSIRPSECLSKAWSREDAGGNVAINVKQSIDYCNRLTCWVSDSILANEEAKKRVVVIKYWAQVAARCRQLNNYNTCMAIISAFDNSAVGRLKKTWELVGNRTTQTLGYIRRLMGANRNFQEYREMIHSVNPPCIPFLGIYLQDLTFIEDGNPDYINKPRGLINFAKRQKAAEVIREINQFQSPPYTFQAVPELQTFVKSHLESSRDIDKLYERSLQLEPREPAS